MEGLAVAVPLRIWELARLEPEERDRRIRAWAADASTEVASGGDILMYGSKKPGGAAKVFNTLAKGLAAGAHCPGGVTFAGRHWCVAECLCPAGVARGMAPQALSPSVVPVARRPVVDLPLPAEDARVADAGPRQLDLLDLLGG